jgi:hypothetical protein
VCLSSAVSKSVEILVIERNSMKLPEIDRWKFVFSAFKAELNSKIELYSIGRKASFIRIFYSTHFQTLDNINRRMALLSMSDNTAVN